MVELVGNERHIKEIEDEIHKTPYNKATQKHIGMLKAKLAKLKASSGQKGGGGLGYAVRKQGDATVILVGFPSVGKSTLLNRLTNAESKVAAYEFTTLTVIPGMLELNGARIQVLDVPGLIEYAASGKGRGREVLSVLRSADLLIIIVSGQESEKQKRIIEDELYQAGFRLNQQPPDVKVLRKSSGGVRIEMARNSQLSQETVREILSEFRVLNADVVIRENLSIDQLVDCLARNRVYVPVLFVANKADLFSFSGDYLKISAMKNEGVQDLKELIWKKLEMKRIFLKKPGKPPDMVEPLIIRGPVKVHDICLQLNLLKHFRFAKIWGPSSRFPGQKVGLEQKLADRDIVEVHN